jgi:hypothetical protein
MEITMEVSCTYTDAVFSPAEVYEMTTLSPQHQRVWRQRGFLGERKYGRASFTAREVAQVMALRYLGQELRVDLESVGIAAAEAAPIIFWWALGVRAAWKVEGATPEQSAAFFQAIETEDRRGLQYLDKMVGVKRGSVWRFLVITPSGHEFLSDLTGHFVGDHIPGAVILDLDALGKELRDAAQRALITVTDIEILGAQAPSPIKGRRSTRR